MQQEQLYQIWDWKLNQVQSVHTEKAFAVEIADRLNKNNAIDSNGLPRFQVMEAND